MAAGDFDNDGRLGLAVGVDRAVHVLRGSGDGTFRPPISTPLVLSHPGGLVAADFNGDGHV